MGANGETGMDGPMKKGGDKEPMGGSTEKRGILPRHICRACIISAASVSRRVRTGGFR